MTSSLCQGQKDLTSEPEADGKTVVEATLARIHSNAILHKLGTINEFLRRVALVETNFGLDAFTFRDGYHGGIWQVDEDKFELTKTSQNVENLRLEIESRFDILWNNVQWMDLRKPLYSALAARLLVATFPTRPSNSILADQASYWKQYYDTPGGPGTEQTEQDFIDEVNELIDSEKCYVSKLDLAFVVDGSGSVGSEHFDIAKNFTKKIVEAFEIGPDRVRVGLIQYGLYPIIEFRLNDHVNKDTLFSDIDVIRYLSGSSTYTGKAIETMADNLFAEGQGARPEEENVPRVAIIMTDGQSSGDVLTPSNRARSHGITLFAIGIGGYVLSELQEIANDPDNEYVFETNNFNVVSNLQSLIHS